MVSSPVFLADAHIYTNHIEQVNIQCGRKPFDLPELAIAEFCSDSEKLTMSATALISKLTPDMFELVGYKYHGILSGKMAV